MPTTWKINSVTFAAAELSNVTRQRYNMATDRMTFEAPARAIDTPVLFDYDAVVTVLRDDLPFFKGRAGRAPKTGSPSSEDQSYEILGPWDQLERLTYQQAWVGGSWQPPPGDPDGDPVWVPRTEYKSRCIIGQDSAGNTQTVAQIISEVIAYANECGVEIESGVISGDTTPPWDEVLDMSCAEIIRRAARWIPSAIGWIDYSTNIPTFHFKPRSGLPSVTLAVGGDALSEVQLTRMGTRSVPAVVIKYERTDDVNGTQMTSIITDAFPPGATGQEIGSVVQTIPLGGGSSNQTTQRQDIRSLELPPMIAGNGALRAWFLSKHPGFTDPKFWNLTITAVARQQTLNLELLEGSLQDWMRIEIPTYNVIGNPIWIPNDHRSYSYSDREDTIKITIAYTMRDDAGIPLRVVQDEIITTKITVTDCPTGRYHRTITDSSYGDAVPEGLAASLYNDLNAPHYQGYVKTVSEEITGSVTVGSLLYIEGGDPAWATMAASIQTISEHIDSGTATLQVGPPAHLTPSEILDLRRANRTRKPAVSATSRTSGESSGGTVDIGSAQPKSIHDYAPGRWGISVSLITDVRFDSVTNCLQVKRRNAIVNYTDSESDWTDMEGGCAEDCNNESS